MTTTRARAGGRGSIWGTLYLHTWMGRFAWAGLLVVLLILTGWLMMRATPSWYRPLDPKDMGVIDTKSRVQNLFVNLHTAVQRVPTGQETSWSITQDEVNSFLAMDSSPTSGNPIADPFVVFGKGTVTVAARLKKLPGNDPLGGVGSMSFSVGIVKDADGRDMAQVKLVAVRAGYLPVPQSIVMPRLQALLPALVTAANQAALLELEAGNPHEQEMTEQIISDIVNGRPFPLDYRYDRKNFAIKELQVDDGVFTVVVGPPQAAPMTVVPRGN